MWAQNRTRGWSGTTTALDGSSPSRACAVGDGVLCVCFRVALGAGGCGFSCRRRGLNGWCVRAGGCDRPGLCIVADVLSTAGGLRHGCKHASDAVAKKNKEQPTIASECNNILKPPERKLVRRMAWTHAARVRSVRRLLD